MSKVGDDHGDKEVKCTECGETRCVMCDPFCVHCECGVRLRETEAKMEQMRAALDWIYDQTENIEIGLAGKIDECIRAALGIEEPE